MTEAQERFLRAIADRVPPASIAEVHLFPAIRQGGHETGIAVIAAEPASVAPPVPGPAADAEPDDSEPGGVPVADAPPADIEPGEAPVAEPTPDDPDPDDAPVADAPPPHRLIVLSARYRLTLKGVDRGQWDIEVLAQADAPLVTVDAVVRGVQRRAGDAGEPERLSGDALRALLDEWSCTAATR